MGDGRKDALRVGFDSRIKLEFQGAAITSDAGLVVYRELGTPLATATFTAHEKGAFYGLETTPRRIMSDALRPRTPVPGLFLSGQDVVTPGIAGSLWSGLLTAAAIDPRIYTRLG